MVHSAYDSIELVKGCPSKIESVASYNFKLLLGCSDCSLRIYSAGDGGGDGEGEIRREAYSLERTVAGFWRKAPVSMEVCRSRDLLLSLSEWIAVHRLPNLETVVAIGKTKGGNVYSWDDRRGFLAVGRQKRVGIYRLDGCFLCLLLQHVFPPNELIVGSISSPSKLVSFISQWSRAHNANPYFSNSLMPVSLSFTESNLGSEVADQPELIFHRFRLAKTTPTWSHQNLIGLPTLQRVCGSATFFRRDLDITAVCTLFYYSVLHMPARFLY